MSFATDYLGQLDRFAAGRRLPRVRALHLPPGQPAEDNLGEFCALELDDGSLGLSYVLLDDTLARMRDEAARSGLPGSDAMSVARRYLDDRGPWKTIGFAAANALTRCLYDRAGFRPDRSADSIGLMQPGPGDHVGMVGLFTPLVGRILATGARLTVLELKAGLAGERDGYRVTLDRAHLADCTKVIATSTLLINDTLDAVLGCCRAARWFAMVGPSAGCLPDGLFARGVTLVGGTWVHETQGFVAALEAGAQTGAYAWKFASTAARYPGWRALVERAGA
ncbi:MAG: hypothetical protein KJ018_13410 [Burkholderiales bacterium]|nr:hypothetical protein [Burkholderiales bacterium]GIK88298.1 MAG: hypothetical protein BroJett026_37790 [Betaproteobacteria bacterium]